MGIGDWGKRRTSDFLRRINKRRGFSGGKTFKIQDLGGLGRVSFVAKFRLFLFAFGPLRSVAPFLYLENRAKKGKNKKCGGQLALSSRDYEGIFSGPTNNGHLVIGRKVIVSISGAEKLFILLGN